MEYFSRGKLLITGEYLVMKGALALAVPVNFGQSLVVSEENAPNLMEWESRVRNKPWFSAKYNTAFFNIVDTNDPEVAESLKKILLAARQINSGFLNLSRGLKVASNIGFDLNWGLGSSSSLISNIAYWAEIDPFELHQRVSEGSGYDVVCARQDGPVFFKKEENNYSLTSAEFIPDFKEKIYFIYLGTKQDSAKSVARFESLGQSYQKEIKLSSELTRQLIAVKTLKEFEKLIDEHETILSGILKMKKLKELRFSDFNGSVKSLGAWGGDFAMITWQEPKEDLIKYLKTKKIDVVFTFDELIKSR